MSYAEPTVAPMSLVGFGDLINIKIVLGSELASIAYWLQQINGSVSARLFGEPSIWPGFSKGKICFYQRSEELGIIRLKFVSDLRSESTR